MVPCPFIPFPRKIYLASLVRGRGGKSYCNQDLLVKGLSIGGDSERKKNYQRKPTRCNLVL